MKIGFAKLKPFCMLCVCYFYCSVSTDWLDKQSSALLLVQEASHGPVELD